MASLASSAECSCVVYTASWHPSSASITKHVLPLLTKTFPHIAFSEASVDDPEHQSKAESLGVSVVPTFVLFTGDRVFGKVEDDDVAEVTILCRSLIESLSAPSSSSPPAPSAPPTIENPTSLDDALFVRIKKLITTSNHKPLVLIKGTAESPRCGFSRQIVELLTEQNVAFETFDILDENQQDIRSGIKVYSDWPTFPQLYYKEELLGGLDIVKEMAEEGSLRSELGLSNEASSTTTDSVEDLDTRLGELIRRSKVILFMKGIPSAPRCGFSRQIVEILEGEKIDFDAFNILEDEEVRQGLKAYSDWPTYPQLYVNGELLGGLDIVKEMVESGELAEELN